MRTHILACEYKGFGCTNGHISLGLLLLGFFGLLLLGLIIAVARSFIGGLRGEDKDTPREPWGDPSPRRGQPAYWAKVDAVTPGGITVRQARCCPRGHVTPAKAVAHAAAVKHRIETTGR